MSDLTFVIAPDYAPEVTRIQVREEAPEVQQTVTIRPLIPTQTATHVARNDEDWTWRELRDYVVNQVERYTGPFPRNDAKEAGIFKRFLGHYGQDAAPIARYAFEVMQGQWKGAPISIGRFSKACDPYFADMIKDTLHRNG